jgi:rhodanese-related sulfurtransferase/predicted double-glycine peptidase
MQIYIAKESRKKIKPFLFCLLVVFINVTYAANENGQNQSATTITIKRPSGPYCGLYCLYTAMQLADREIDFRELIKKEYLGSRDGSSLTELKKAAEDFGLYAKPVGRLTSKVLTKCNHPVILHVKPTLESPRFNHYELFLGTDTRTARIFDPPSPVRAVSFAELAPRWDGNGLIISDKPIDLGSVLAPRRKLFMFCAAIAITIVISLRYIKKRLPKTSFNSPTKLFVLSVAQVTVFIIAATLCGLFHHFTCDEGLLANANAVSTIQRAHLGNFIPKIGERRVHKLLKDNTVFIDARFADDYKAGHIDGAISVPVDANDIELQTATAEIPKDADIVLYCQSSKCKFAEIVAIKLIEDGYSNICIFRGGWVEWIAQNGRPREVAI